MVISLDIPADRPPVAPNRLSVLLGVLVLLMLSHLAQ